MPTANCPPVPYPYSATAGGRPPFNVRYAAGSGRPPPFSRGHVKHVKVKGKKGKKGKKETYDLIVNINLVKIQLFFKSPKLMD